MKNLWTVISGMRAFTLLLLLASSWPASLHAQPHASTSIAIKSLLDKQAADWNAGNLEAFATGYKNSPDILFMGITIQHGYAQMLARYRKAYSSRARMGKLTFSDLETASLDEHFATTTGHYHLDRSREGGGNADGYFLLVLENTAAGWKIVRDDTTTTSAPVTPAPAAR